MKAKVELRDGHGGLLQCRLDPRDQHALQRIDAGFKIIGRSSLVRRQDPPRLVDQQEVCLGTAAVDTEKSPHRGGFQG